jgi:hypothetical protein
MDLHERQDLKDFLVSLYGSKANKWPINESIFNLTYKLVAESGLCSGMMDFVPRPMPPGASAMKYLAKQARGIFLRTIRQNKKQYISCIKTVALKMRNDFDLAAMGY